MIKYTKGPTIKDFLLAYTSMLGLVAIMILIFIVMVLLASLMTAF